MTLVDVDGLPPLDVDELPGDQFFRRIKAAAAEGIAANARRALRAFGHADGELIELQALDVPDGKWKNNLSAYTRSAAKVVALLAQVEPRKAEGVYFLFNKAKEEIAARYKPDTWRVMGKDDGTTTDSDMEARRAIYIDVDWDRRSGISTTDAQLRATLVAVQAIADRLAKILGDANAISMGCSGNCACAFLTLVPQLETPELAAMVKTILACLKALHGSDEIKIDLSVSEAKRLCPAFGSTKRKGDPDAPGRPHRRAVILTPAQVKPLDRAGLDKLVAGLLAQLTPEHRAEVDKMVRAKGGAKSSASNGKSNGAKAPRADSAAESDDPFTHANDCDPREVADRLGLLDGDVLTCPGCREASGPGGRVVILERGLKCSGDRCTDKGRNGFRTNVDLVMEVTGCTPIEAVRTLGDWFNFEVPSPKKTTKKQRQRGAKADAKKSAGSHAKEKSSPNGASAEARPTSSGDYYSVLGVERDADAAAIKSAYKKRARETHPDHHPDDPTAKENFEKVTEAYGVLSDPERRGRYDQQRKSAAKFHAANVSDRSRRDVVAGPFLAHSYLSAVMIFTHDVEDILRGRKLGFNQMTAAPTVDGVELQDHDLTTFRSDIALLIPGIDKDGDAVELHLCRGDICDAVLQVAHTNEYHPVRSYLRSLRWDGEQRIKRVAVEILKATDTRINQAIVRCFFLSAVARPIQPGCKVDTMMILVGEQGWLKSTFFSTLAGEWFCDSPIDIHSKDAFLTLRGAWILEFGELSSLQRAKDHEAVKVFLASKKDTYRLPFGRLNTTVPRSGVIGGTTNKPQCLADETGARRHHPIQCGGELDIARLADWRDQLWAEAVALYDAAATCPACVAEPTKRCAHHRWWLTPEEDELIKLVHEEHSTSDAWTDLVLEWASDPRSTAELGGDSTTTMHFSPDEVVPCTTANILKYAINKEPKQWSKGDEMRVAAILVMAGWKDRKPHRGPRIWERKAP